MVGNDNNYGGYKPSELYVPQKFLDYKEETLQHITMQQYELIIDKANQYMETDLVKNLKAANMDALLHYGIQSPAPISISHVTSIILYCDLTKYSTMFSESFRKLNSFETINSVRRRNEEFWWQSKLLKETVEYYGTDGMTEDNLGGERGPFCMYPLPVNSYHGAMFPKV